MTAKRCSIMFWATSTLCVAAIACACDSAPGVSSGAAGNGGAGSGGSASSGGGGGAGTGAGAGAGAGGDDTLTVEPQCVGLQCQQVACEGGASTTVSGVVYAPEGTIALYNAVVYVPNAPVEPMKDGASCEPCGAPLSGSPLVTALTDTLGRFVLKGVPAGDNIPLVIQVGKFRRQITLPSVLPCQDNPVADPALTRLPRSTAEGDLPRIALTTGGADPLECLLRKIGIDDSEVTTSAGQGRVHLYKGSGGSAELIPGLNGGATFPEVLSLWGQKETLMNYDIVLLACEGGPLMFEKPPEALQAMFDYTAAGGRVFASHWQNYWLEQGPAPFPETAVFHHQPDLDSPILALVDTTFPKGEALASWLVNVGASPSPGEIEIVEAQHTVDLVNPLLSRQWIYQPDFGSVQYFTFNTPAGAPADQQCGRVVFSDIHVASGDQTGVPFPSGCKSKGLTPQEKALLFMLFDLSSCVLPDDDPPMKPPT